MVFHQVQCCCTLFQPVDQWPCCHAARHICCAVRGGSWSRAQWR